MLLLVGYGYGLRGASLDEIELVGTELEGLVGNTDELLADEKLYGGE